MLAEKDLHALAEFAVEADLLVISDEVYEHLVYDGRRHLPLATYPGMAERTVTISSAAKMFNCTGWKIGWACGTPELIGGVRAAKQYLSYVGGAPFQPAVAYALESEGAWVAALRSSLWTSSIPTVPRLRAVTARRRPCRRVHRAPGADPSITFPTRPQEFCHAPVHTAPA